MRLEYTRIYERLLDKDLEETIVTCLKVLTGHLVEETENINEYFVTVINPSENRKGYLPNTRHFTVTPRVMACTTYCLSLPLSPEQ
jgi:hypothetical protein